MRLRKLLTALATAMVCLTSTSTHSAIWSDVWFTPSESGWGINVSQQGTVIYIMWFVYDQNQQPHWYVAAAEAPTIANNQPYAAFVGNIVTANGPWFGGAFNPASVSGAVVGTVSFLPQTTYQALLTYTINGVSVTKVVQRETWRHIQLGGFYQGGYAIAFNTCGGNQSGTGSMTLGIAADVGADGISGNIVSTFNLDGTGACVVSGTYKQWGSIYSVSNVAECAASGQLGGLRINYTDLSSTDDGIDGNMLLTGQACQIGLRFSAARQ